MSSSAAAAPVNTSALRGMFEPRQRVRLCTARENRGESKYDLEIGEVRAKAAKQRCGRQRVRRRRKSGNQQEIEQEVRSIPCRGEEEESITSTLTPEEGTHGGQR